MTTVFFFCVGSGRPSGAMRSYDGYIDEIYSHLWSKDAQGRGCEHVMIPDTVIFKYRLIEAPTLNPNPTTKG